VVPHNSIGQPQKAIFGKNGSKTQIGEGIDRKINGLQIHKAKCQKLSH
jgi:hypothetical protein